MRHTTVSLAVIGAFATGLATIAAAFIVVSAAPAVLSTASAAAHHAAAHAVLPGTGRNAAGTPKTSSSPSTATSKAGTSLLKPLLTGALNRQGFPPLAYRSVMGGYDVQGTHDAQGNRDVGNVSWAELEPKAGGPIAANNAIDQAIVQVRAWNAGNPTHPMFLKLRIAAGIHSPAWALNLGGTCFHVTDPTSSVSGCCPRFWTPQFTAAYYQFEALLAAKYDTVPEVREVLMAKNTTVYNESLIRQTQSKATVVALTAAGYSATVDEQQQIQDVVRLGKYWKHTHVGFAFNPYQSVNPNAQDEAFTQTLIASGRRALGDQLVIENNSLRQILLSGNGQYQTMYAYMTETGGPIGFQTASLSKVGSIATVLDGAASMGATSVELPAGYESQISPTQLATIEASLPGSST